MVEDYDVERFAVMPGALDFADRAEAVIDRDACHPERIELPRQNSLVHLDVIDDQGAQAPETLRATRDGQRSGRSLAP